MQATIKTRPAFRTLRQAAVLDYTLVLDSLEDMSSAARVKGEIPRSCVGGWLILSDAVWLISSITPGRGDTDLGLQGPGEAFSRPRLYTAYSGTVGGFLARELEAYRDESDAVYALPYLVVHDYDNTPFVLPELDDNGLYILAFFPGWKRKAVGAVLALATVAALAVVLPQMSFKVVMGRSNRA